VQPLVEASEPVGASLAEVSPLGPDSASACTPLGASDCGPFVDTQPSQANSSGYHEYRKRGAALRLRLRCAADRCRRHSCRASRRRLGSWARPRAATARPVPGAVEAHREGRMRCSPLGCCMVWMIPRAAELGSANRSPISSTAPAGTPAAPTRRIAACLSWRVDRCPRAPCRQPRASRRCASTARRCAHAERRRRGYIAIVRPASRTAPVGRRRWCGAGRARPRCRSRAAFRCRCRRASDRLARAPVATRR
jgi:hypothetical protein